MLSINESWQAVKRYQDQLWIILIVLASVSLLLGLWQLTTYDSQREPLVIENVPESSANLANLANVSSGVGEGAVVSANPVAQSPAPGKYVASKNGTKYYLPTCAGANRIKEENRVWFASVEEARARGLAPAANCKGL